MNQENMQFEFMGFDPDYKIRARIESVAEKISGIAPSDAAIKMAVQKGKGAIRASCRIASKAGVFVAEAASKNPILAVQQIEKKIKHQLDDWKAWRFRRPAGSVFDNKNVI